MLTDLGVAPVMATASEHLHERLAAEPRPEPGRRGKAKATPPFSDGRRCRWLPE